MEVDRGEVVDWPIEFKHPCKRNLKINPTLMSELRAFFASLYGSDLEYIQPRIDQYGRCVVNGVIFSSDFNSTDRGSIVKCMFTNTSNELEPFFGVVRFYFTVNTVINSQAKMHRLTYVTWLKFRAHGHELWCLERKHAKSSRQ